MPTPRNVNIKGATRYFLGHHKCSAKKKPARCPACGQKHTTGMLPGTSGWHYCRECNLEFNQRTGTMKKPLANGKAHEVKTAEV